MTTGEVVAIVMVTGANGERALNITLHKSVKDAYGPGVEGYKNLPAFKKETSKNVAGTTLIDRVEDLLTLPDQDLAGSTKTFLVSKRSVFFLTEVVGFYEDVRDSVRLPTVQQQALLRELEDSVKVMAKLTRAGVVVGGAHDRGGGGAGNAQMLNMELQAAKEDYQNLTASSTKREKTVTAVCGLALTRQVQSAAKTLSATEQSLEVANAELSNLRRSDVGKQSELSKAVAAYESKDKELGTHVELLSDAKEKLAAAITERASVQKSLDVVQAKEMTTKDQLATSEQLLKDANSKLVSCGTEQSTLSEAADLVKDAKDQEAAAAKEMATKERLSTSEQSLKKTNSELASCKAKQSELSEAADVCNKSVADYEFSAWARLVAFALCFALCAYFFKFPREWSADLLITNLVGSVARHCLASAAISRELTACTSVRGQPLRGMGGAPPEDTEAAEGARGRGRSDNDESIGSARQEEPCSEEPRRASTVGTNSAPQNQATQHRYNTVHGEDHYLVVGVGGGAEGKNTNVGGGGGSGSGVNTTTAVVLIDTKHQVNHNEKENQTPRKPRNQLFARDALEFPLKDRTQISNQIRAWIVSEERAQDLKKRAQDKMVKAD